MIKMLVMDVDGTLTDGGIYISEFGESFKRFHVKDGYAIKDMLPRMNILPVIITGRNSQIVSQRCQELGIQIVRQGCKDKVSELKDIAGEYTIDLKEVAYIGDDMNDYECMKIVGKRGAPSDAVNEIKAICDFVADSQGGYGAVREFVEWIKSDQGEEWRVL